ncbi:MAG: DsbA family protein [Oleiphilaceae bacterium]|nr:DsbA family protein [Oleiphilaceae bacterium]
MDPARPLRSFLIRRVTDPQRLAKAREKQEQRRIRRGEPHKVLYFHQLDDPYSQLAAQAIGAFLDRYPVQLEFLPVARPTPIAIHDEQLWNHWAEQDAAAIAPYHYCNGEPLRLDPVTTPSPDALAMAQRLLCEPRPPRQQAQLAVTAGEALARGDQSRIAALLAEHGGASDSLTEATLAENDQLRHQLGHYLGGMFYYAGEWYWGIDRLHYLEERLDALAVRHREAPAGPSVTLKRQAPDAEIPAAAAPLTLEYFPSLRSPYSHISYGRVKALCERYPIDLHVRPVLPMMMRGVKADRRKAFYIMKDTQREAQRLGVAFGKVWDPFGKPVLKAYSLFPWARDQGLGLEYLHQYSQAVWAEGINAWRLSGLRRIVERTGLDWNEARQRLDNRDWEPELEENVRDMIAAGSWGVPTLRLPATDTQPAFTLWGQDRIWRMEEEILKRLKQDNPR